MSARRYRIDTNILFYSVDPSDAARQKRAASWLSRAARVFDCGIPRQAFCEVYHAVTRKGPSRVETWQDLYLTAYPSSKTVRSVLGIIKLNLALTAR